MQNTLKHFMYQSKIHQFNSDFSAVKGKLLIAYMRRDVIHVLCCTIIRICHTNFKCATDV